MYVCVCVCVCVVCVCVCVCVFERNLFKEIHYVYHYENTPIQIYRIFYHQINENFQITNSDIFLISAQNIDCGYSLEPPRLGGSNEYP